MADGSGLWRNTSTLGSPNELSTRVDETWKPLLPGDVRYGLKLPTSCTPRLFPGPSNWPGCRGVRCQPLIHPWPPPLPLRPGPLPPSRACTSGASDTWRPLGRMVIMPPPRISLFVSQLPMSTPPFVSPVSGCFAAFCKAVPILCTKPSLAASWDRAGRFATPAPASCPQLMACYRPSASCRWRPNPCPGCPLFPGHSPGVPTNQPSRHHAESLGVTCGAHFGQVDRKLSLELPCPRPAQLCQAVLPPQHALAAHLHRMHGQVALSTQYTCGTSCLWCLSEFHNSDWLRYHLQHSASCEHGLRCVVGPVYTYGSGTKIKGLARKAISARRSIAWRDPLMQRPPSAVPPLKVVFVPRPNLMRNCSA